MVAAYAGDAGRTRAPPGTSTAAQQLAALIGCEQATLAPSTLHLFWDFFAVLSAQPLTIFLDAEVYAVARWGVERAAARGARVYTFRHHDPNRCIGCCAARCCTRVCRWWLPMGIARPAVVRRRSLTIWPKFEQ